MFSLSYGIDQLISFAQNFIDSFKNVFDLDISFLSLLKSPTFFCASNFLGYQPSFRVYLVILFSASSP